jgi:tRNA (guanine37-N1)-methyltransferase
MESILSMGMLAIAKKKGMVSYRCLSPREFTSDFHRTVDDEPYGGGAGMVMMAQPIVDAVESLGLEPGSPVILLGPEGRRFDQDAARRFAEESELTFICGRYKGVDERVRDLVVTDVVSTGDYILSGGELAAAVCIEATVRLLKDVLGNEDSKDTDSFEAAREGLLDCAWYTRPVEFRGLKVPDVLLSGHHRDIEKWRIQSSIDRTRKYRPDLLKDKYKE